MRNRQPYEKPEAEIFVLCAGRVLLNDSENLDGNEKPVTPGGNEENFD